MTITGSDNKNYKVIFANANLTTTGLAENEYDYGDYFAWGAIRPWYSSIDKTSSSWTATWEKSGGYTGGNAPYYNNDTYTDGNTLKAADDAANVILGGDWQLPTKEIWVALYGANTNTVNWGPNGDKALEPISGIQGMKITKKDDSNTYLFLPAAGQVGGITFYHDNTLGYYWSGTAVWSTAAYFLTFKSGNVDALSDSRAFGYSVRPVRLVEVPQ